MSNTLVNVGNLTGSTYSEADIRELLSNFAAYKTQTDADIASLNLAIKNLVGAQALLNDGFVTYGSIIKIQNGYQGFGEGKYLNAYSNFIAREGVVGAGGRTGEYKFLIKKWLPTDG
jgi:hypothetical protein